MEFASCWTLANSHGMPCGGTAVRNLPPVACRSVQSPLRLQYYPSGPRPRRRTTFKKEHLLVTCCTQSTKGEGDRRPPDAVPKPYTGVEDGDVKHVPDLNIGVGHPQVVCSIVPLLGDLGVKKPALLLFSTLKGLLGDTVEFVIKPTKHEGTGVGINCRLDWKKTLHLGKGCSFFTHHTYQGKTSIRNVEAITQSIARNAVLKLILLGCFGPFLSPMLAVKVVHGEGRARLVVFLVLLLAIAVSLMLAKNFHQDT